MHLWVDDHQAAEVSHAGRGLQKRSPSRNSRAACVQAESSHTLVSRRSEADTRMLPSMTRPTKEPAAARAGPGRALVAVIDDDESVRESLPDLLRELGFAARAYASADEFLA